MSKLVLGMAKQIISSRRHPTRAMKTGQWAFANPPGVLPGLFHKFGGVLHKWTVDRPEKEYHWWKEHQVSANAISPGGSGATLGVIDTAKDTVLAYALDATDEYLYFSSCVDDDWDGQSDIIVYVYVALGAAETSGDTIETELNVEYYGDHDNVSTPKGQQRTVSHDVIGAVSQHDVHELIFVVNWDETDNVVEVDDVMHYRFRLTDVTDIAVFFLYAKVFYRMKRGWQADKYYSMPTEG